MDVDCPNPAAPACSADHQCVQCVQDADCTKPKAPYCTDWHQCVQCKTNADCSNTEECVNAVCRVHCWSSADCGMCEDAPVCSMGYCLSNIEANPQCRTQAQCPAGESCVNGTCKL